MHSLGTELPKRPPTWIWLSLLIILAAGLRLPSIGRESLWFDEAVSYLAATLSVPQILDNTVQSSHPPLYYLLLHFWRLWLPDTDAVMRIPGLLWNLLLVPAVYLLAQELFGRRQVSLLAALMVSVSPFHVLYSHELRMYTQLMFLVTVGTWAYWRARQTRKWIWWTLFGFAYLAALYTHLFAAFSLLAINIHAFLSQLGDGRIQRRTLLVSLVIVLLFVPWLILLAGELQKEVGSLRPLAQRSVRNPIKLLTSLAFLLFGMSNSLLKSGLSLFMGLAILVVSLMQIRKVRQESVPPGVTLIILMLLSVIVIPVTLYLIRPFFLPERTMAAGSPFLFILLAWTTTRRQSPLPYLVALSIVLMVINSVSYAAGGPQKPPYRDISSLVIQRMAERDAILHTSDGSYLPALRYTNLSRHAVLAGDPDPRKPVAVYQALGGEVWSLSQAAGSAERLWLIVALEHSVDWQKEQAAYFAARYPQLEAHEIGGINVMLYQLREGLE